MGELDPSDKAVMTLNGLAEGGIGPEPRNVDEQSLNEFAEALAGDSLFVRADGYVPHKCVDGRSRLDNANTLGPDAAGGTESLVVSDALTFGTLRKPGEKAPDHTKNVMQFWMDRGQEVGGHDADAAHGGSGCGACDKLAGALDYISRRGDELRDVIAGLGVEVDDATHNLVRENAKQLHAEGYADNGPSIIAAMREVAGHDAVETLTGEHKEVVVVINTKADTTLDRGQVRSKFGDDLQAFNVDVWALEKCANEMYPDDPAKARASLYAALCYNVAVAAILSHSSLRIVVR